SMKDKKEAIADFSELGPYLDLPVRYYSAGMLVRLAFSIATAMDPEILLVDEVLSAGDLAFQAKARGRIREMVQRAGMMVLVSHDLESVVRLCDRAIWLDHGQVIHDGPAADVAAAYLNSVQSASADSTAREGGTVGACLTT